MTAPQDKPLPQQMPGEEELLRIANSIDSRFAPAFLPSVDIANEDVPKVTSALRYLALLPRCEEATKIDCGACDFCAAVHVNLRGRDGECFATASLPLENCEPFIAQLRAAMSELAQRHSAPAERQ